MLARVRGSPSDPQIFVDLCESSIRRTGAEKAMPGQTFGDMVEACFASCAVEAAGCTGKVLFQPGLEGLQVLLEGCLSEATEENISADMMSVEALRQISMIRDGLWICR